MYAFADRDWSRKNQRNHPLKAGLLLISVVLLAASFSPLLNMVSASLQRDQAFPVIADFGTGWTRAFLQLNRAALTQVADQQGLTATKKGAERPTVQLTLKPGRYPGVAMVEPCMDWSGYGALSLELYSPHANPINIVLRIHDYWHNQAYSDRFNRTLTLRPGSNRIQIPLSSIVESPAGREMDMKRIGGLMLFVVDVEDTIRLYPGVIRLE